MSSSCVIFGTVVTMWIGIVVAEPEFCNRGFEVAHKFRSCWDRASDVHPFDKNFESERVYTPQMVQEYAAHMCSYVKPMAMECLRNATVVCDQQSRLLQIADDSGGACLHNHLSPHFKHYVIDHLTPVVKDPECFLIGDSSNDCYVKAGRRILASRENHEDIDHFHHLADKFFGFIWDCHIDLFKGYEDVCPDWQIPMLLAVQNTAMPSLFGSKVSLDQVAKLELPSTSLADVSTSRPVTTGREVSNETDCEKVENRETTSYLLIRTVKDKGEAQPGDIVIELSAKKQQRQLSIARGPSFDGDVHDLVEQLLDENGLLDERKVRQRMREHKKRQREIEAYLKRIEAARKEALRSKKRPVGGLSPEAFHRMREEYIEAS